MRCLETFIYIEYISIFFYNCKCTAFGRLLSFYDVIHYIINQIFRRWIKVYLFIPLIFISEQAPTSSPSNLPDDEVQLCIGFLKEILDYRCIPRLYGSFNNNSVIQIICTFNTYADVIGDHIAVNVYFVVKRTGVLTSLFISFYINSVAGGTGFLK